MGCVNSRTDINDLHPNIFQVMNVDDLGNLVTPGRLEITSTDIILHQRGKQPIKWPLRCLRRYGYDAEIFSFESGRRCSTGPGIYAFKCRRAAHLFNLVQSNIQVCNNSGDDAVSRELPLAFHPGPTVTRVAAPAEPNYLDPTPTRISNWTGARFIHNQQNGIGRLGSVGSSNGPLSPQATTGSPSPPLSLPPPPPPPLPQPHPSSLYVNEEVLASMSLEAEHNNNKSLSRSVPRSSAIDCASNSGLSVAESTAIYKNQEIISQAKSLPVPTVSYMNIDLGSDASPLSPNHSIFSVNQLKEETKEIGPEHAYMNISTSQEQVESAAVKIRPPPLPSIQPDAEDGTRHWYANLEASDIEGLRKRYSGISVAEKSPLLPSTPTSGPSREVNYAVLDLDTKDIPNSSSVPDTMTVTVPSPPESPVKLQKGYATIDFNKTAALSHSVNPNLVNDNEGSRKTRHNSTINDLTSPCRHSSSVSE